MITASHLPFNRNGFKFCTASGGLEKGDISTILQQAAAYREALDDDAVYPGPDSYADVAHVMAMCLAVQPSHVEYVRMHHAVLHEPRACVHAALVKGFVHVLAA